MSDSYFAPMYGGIANPTDVRVGSVRFGMGSGFYGNFHDDSDPSSPFSDASMASPFYESSPTNDVEPSYFGYQPVSPKNQASLVDLENFSFKRLRSLDSGTLESADVSPVSRVSKASRTSPTHISVTRRPMPQPTVQIEMPYADNEGFEIPPLRLGDDGRSRLKSALSEQVKHDADIRAQIEAIGKIRLASIQQLMQMARVSGLWDYAQYLALENETTKKYRRTG